MRTCLAFLVLTFGCHSILHSTDPLHEQISEIVSIHDQKVADGYGEVTRAKLTTQGAASTENPTAVMLHQPTSLMLDGVRGEQLCFSLSRNMSAVDGVDRAKADAKARYAAHYAYFYFRDLKEVSDKTVWPTMATAKPMDVSTGGSEGVEGATHVDSEGDTRKAQDSIDVVVKLCGAIPVVPPDAKWFAVALVYPYDEEERNRVMLWQIVDEPPAEPPASE